MQSQVFSNQQVQKELLISPPSQAHSPLSSPPSEMLLSLSGQKCTISLVSLHVCVLMLSSLNLRTVGPYHLSPRVNYSSPVLPPLLYTLPIKHVSV